MKQPAREIVRGYTQTFATVGRLLLYRQLAFRRLAGFPVNLLACLLNRRPPLPPPVLQIDITNRCNLSCPGCLTGMGFHKNRPGMMPYENFQALIDEIGRFTALAVLYNSGEPLLHPEAIEMIRLLTRHRIASVISTNGHFIKTRQDAERLVDSGLSAMVVSLSGATQAVYERYHRGGNLGQVIRGVRLVIEARRTLQKRTPLILFRFLVMDHNAHERQAMAALAKNTGCDGFEFRTVKWQARLLETPPASAGHEGRSAQKAAGYCLWPWLISVVNWNGDVYPCCFYNLDLPVMGNTIEAGSMKAVWAGRDYDRFRKRIRDRAACPPACRDCPAEIGFQTRFSGKKRTVYLYPVNRSNHKTGI